MWGVQCLPLPIPVHAAELCAWLVIGLKWERIGHFFLNFSLVAEIFAVLLSRADTSLIFVTFSPDQPLVLHPVGFGFSHRWIHQDHNDRVPHPTNVALPLWLSMCWHCFVSCTTDVASMCPYCSFAWCTTVPSSFACPTTLTAFFQHVIQCGFFQCAGTNIASDIVLPCSLMCYHCSFNVTGVALMSYHCSF